MKKILIIIAAVFGVIILGGIVSGIFDAAMKDKDILESLNKAVQEIKQEKQAVGSYYKATARLPEGNVSKALGIASTRSVPSINIESINVASGGIIYVTFTEKASNAILLFTPKIEGGQIVWECSSSNVQKKKLLPQECS